MEVVSHPNSWNLRFYQILKVKMNKGYSIPLGNYNFFLNIGFVWHRYYNTVFFICKQQKAAFGISDLRSIFYPSHRITLCHK